MHVERLSRLDILIPEVTPENYKDIMRLPSVLGMDILSKYRVCFDGVFVTFVVDLMRERLDTATDMGGLLSSLTRYENPVKENGDLFLRLSNEAVNELGANERKHLLHHMKLEIEDKMLSQAKNPSLYERMQDVVKDKPDLVAVEGICEKCQCTIAIAISTIEYIQNTQILPSGPLIFEKCPRCKERDCLLIPVV